MASRIYLSFENFASKFSCVCEVDNISVISSLRPKQTKCIPWMLVGDPCDKYRDAIVAVLKYILSTSTDLIVIRANCSQDSIASVENQLVAALGKKMLRINNKEMYGDNSAYSFNDVRIVFLYGPLKERRTKYNLLDLYFIQWRTGDIHRPAIIAPQLVCNLRNFGDYMACEEKMEISNFIPRELPRILTNASISCEPIATLDYDTKTCSKDFSKTYVQISRKKPVRRKLSVDIYELD